MKKIIYSKFDKHDISDLPQVVFGGRIFVIATKAEAEKAVSYLLSQDIFGASCCTNSPNYSTVDHVF